MSRFPFPPAPGRAALLAAGALLLALGLLQGPPGARAQEEPLLDRISNRRMIEFERELEREVNQALRRYLAPGQYVLSVRVIWDRNVIPAQSSPELSPDKTKLPGFPIFVRSPGEPVEDRRPPVTRLVVKVLLDQSLPDYYERFLRKIVPLVAKFVPSRGDQLIVLKETFPELTEAERRPTVPEKELMDQVEQPLAEPPAERRRRPPAAPEGEAARPPEERARLAYEEGRYREALRIVQRGFQQATGNRERARFLAMEGSLHYTLDDTEAARAAWRRALQFDPDNREVQRVLAFLAGNGGGGGAPPGLPMEER